MNFQTWGFLLLCIFFSQKSVFAKNTPGDDTILRGKITDATTGEPLAGASIYLPDLKTGTVSELDGSYLIARLPKRSVLVQVSFLGYRQIVEKIDLHFLTEKNFALQPAVTEAHEVVITGSAQSVEMNRTPTPILVVGQRELLQVSSTNIIAALAGLPGIAQVTTGAGISKPVIRGLGFNRVVVVKDGIRQEGQQWGDEHGIEIDEFSVQKVEILKGPASLAFGSDAMAGVINFIAAPTLPDGQIAANFLSNYQTNNGLAALSANFMGNKKGLIWDVRGSGKWAHAFKNRFDGRVFNSGFREKSVGGIVGLNKSWGYSHLHFSSYSIEPGLVEGERDSLTGLFLKPILIDPTTVGSVLATDGDLESYSNFLPFQKIGHRKIVLNNSLVLGESTLKTTLGFQQNSRKEFGDVLLPEQFGLFFRLNTVNYGVQFNFPEKRQFNFSIGANGMRQISKNRGIEFLVPEYRLFDAGIFAIGKKSMGKLDLGGGLRFDRRGEQADNLFLNKMGEKVDGPGAEVEQRFKSFGAAFLGISGSLGATYQFSEVFFGKINAARGFRAPNIAELGSNGEHEGTGRFEIGDPRLQPENSWQGDLALGLNSGHVTAGLDLFGNRIDHFIFSKKLAAADGRDSLTDGMRTFKFGAGTANLFGGEFSIDVHPHPLDWLHFGNAFSWVGAVQFGRPDSTRFLPRTPGAKLSTELRADAKKLGKNLENGYFRVRLDHNFAQDRVFSAFGTETKTGAYSLLEVGLGADFTRKKRRALSVFISANNLLDAGYQSHLSRLKYAPTNLATGRPGVFEMGRNFSVKVLVPVGF